MEPVEAERPEKLREFEARIARGEKIEPGDWMPEANTAAS
jgi:ring-1,2-phenylacetyl-CoA epoxidase subunit PaaA